MAMPTRGLQRVMGKVPFYLEVTCFSCRLERKNEVSFNTQERTGPKQAGGPEYIQSTQQSRKGHKNWHQYFYRTNINHCDIILIFCNCCVLTLLFINSKFRWNWEHCFSCSLHSFLQTSQLCMYNYFSWQFLSSWKNETLSCQTN